jgi:hypothetical protein
VSPDPSASARSLPPRPDLRHLKDQARALHRAGVAKSLSAAQLAIARQYGFASWPRLAAHVKTLGQSGALKAAIDRDDLDAVITLMTQAPALHRASMGYAGNGPLTWAAECRTSGDHPSPARLAIAKWMLAHGSDVHQGGDGPLMRAALRGSRVPMMELLVAHGANVNAEWNGHFPILFASCETVDATALAWLLSHGADPNRTGAGRTETALDALLGGYLRSPELVACIDLLVAAGGTSRHDLPGVLAVVRGDVSALQRELRADPTLVHRRYPTLDCGSTGGRRLLLRHATLLHVAAEFGSREAAQLLLDGGADVNAVATRDAQAVGGQTALFHAVTQFHDSGLAVAQLLLERGIDLSVRARVPGHYERMDEIIECTALGYALRFPGDEFPGSNARTIALLRAHEASE